MIYFNQNLANSITQINKKNPLTLWNSIIKIHIQHTIFIKKNHNINITTTRKNPFATLRHTKIKKSIFPKRNDLTVMENFSKFPRKATRKFKLRFRKSAWALLLHAILTPRRLLPCHGLCNSQSENCKFTHRCASGSTKNPTFEDENRASGKLAENPPESFPKKSKIGAKHEQVNQGARQ